MTNMARRFLVGVVIVGSLVVGSIGTARATVSVHGPYTWYASGWPTPVDTGYTASTGFCWLSGFDIGSFWGTQFQPAKLDQAYVYLASNGHWMVSGAGKDTSTAPSSGTWAQAHCVDLSSGGATLFMPQTGNITQVACPSPFDHATSGTCYTATNGSTSSSANNTWSNSGSFANNAWNNSFIGIMGIGYNGVGLQQQFRFNSYPNTVYDYISKPITTWIQPTNGNTQVAWGGIWPWDNAHLFCAMGQYANCYGVDYTVSAYTAGAQLVRDSWGNPIYASDYACALNHFQTSGQDGEVSAKLAVNGSGQWTLAVTGPVFSGIYASADAYCFPIPYYLAEP